MTDMLRHELEDRMEEAEKSGDQARINAARKAIDRATLECQAHTAERVKKIEKDAAETRQDVRDIKTQMTGIATSRAVLTEKYDATTEAVNSLKTEVKALKGLRTAFYWFAGAMLLALIYGALGPRGFNAVTTAHHTIPEQAVEKISH